MLMIIRKITVLKNNNHGRLYEIVKKRILLETAVEKENRD